MRLLLFNLATDVDDPILGFTTRWIQALAKRVEFIHVLTMRTGRVEVADNVRVYSVGKEKGFSEPHRVLEFYRHLVRMLREDRIDVCFSHMIPVFTVLGAPVLRLMGVPIITWYAHPSLTWTLKWAHHLSDRMVTSLETAYPYRHNKLAVLGQGIDTDLFSPDPSVMPDDPPLILCVGRLSPVKDHPTLLKAIALLRESRGKPFRVIILGGPAGPEDEHYARSLHRQVQDLGIQQMVYFEPSVAMVNLPSWYQRSTLCVNLTPTGFGDKVALEAMSCARPCVVANEGFRETLGEYAGSLLSQNQNPQDLARRLRWLLSLPEEIRGELGVYLREHVVERHDLAKLTENLVCVFRKEQACKG